MERNTLLSAIAFILLIGGIGLYFILNPAPVKAPVETPTASSTPFSAAPYTVDAQYYDIAANFPTTTPLTSSAGAAANTAAITAMQTWVQNSIHDFTHLGTVDLDNLSPADAQQMGLGGGRKYQLQITYLIGSSAHTLSYIFTLYQDTGGAHGNTFFKTFVFDKNSGALLSLDTVFTGANYLDTLSTLAKGYVTKNLGTFADSRMIADGTTPEKKNFENFFFDNGTFAILFPPYQVAAYAAGPQTVRLNASDLSSVMNPKYP